MGEKEREMEERKGTGRVSDGEERRESERRWGPLEG